MASYDEQMSVETAEALGAISADLLQVLLIAAEKHPGLRWRDLVAAVYIVGRGVEAMARKADSDLTKEMAHSIMGMQFLRVMALPDEAWRIIDDGTGDGPTKTGWLPVRKH